MTEELLLVLCNDDIKLPPFKMEAVAALGTALGLTAIRGVFRLHDLLERVVEADDDDDDRKMLSNLTGIKAYIAPCSIIQDQVAWICGNGRLNATSCEASENTSLPTYQTLAPNRCCTCHY